MRTRTRAHTHTCVYLHFDLKLSIRGPESIWKGMLEMNKPQTYGYMILLNSLDLGSSGGPVS